MTAVDNRFPGFKSLSHRNQLQTQVPFPALSTRAALFRPNNQRRYLYSSSQTDAYGHRRRDVAEPGVYTVVYYSPNGFQIVLPDQTIAAPYSGQTFNSESQPWVRLAARSNGVNTSFMLSAPPTPPRSALFLMVNGLVVSAYSFSGTSIRPRDSPRPRTLSLRLTLLPYLHNLKESSCDLVSS